MADAQSPLAPTPQFPERAPTEFQRKGAPSPIGNQGPVRFEEGLATDPDVPADFVTGIVQGNSSAPGRPNRNANVFEKPAEETMKERAQPLCFMGRGSDLPAGVRAGKFLRLRGPRLRRGHPRRV